MTMIFRNEYPSPYDGHSGSFRIEWSMSLRQRLRCWWAMRLHGCTLHYEREKGKTARVLGGLGKGRRPVCSVCHALCVLDAFEAKHVRRESL